MKTKLCYIVTDTSSVSEKMGDAKSTQHSKIVLLKKKRSTYRRENLYVMCRQIRGKNSNISFLLLNSILCGQGGK